jgi:hypothetical protein
VLKDRGVQRRYCRRGCVGGGDWECLAGQMLEP